MQPESEASRTPDPMDALARRRWPPPGVAAVSVGALLLGTWAISKGLSPSGPANPVWPVVAGGWAFVSGGGMLRGAKWARLSFCIWAVVILLLGLFTTSRVDLGVWLLIACVYFVNNRKASEFFGGSIWPLSPKPAKTAPAA